MKKINGKASAHTEDTLSTHSFHFKAKHSEKRNRTFSIHSPILRFCLCLHPPIPYILPPLFLLFPPFDTLRGQTKVFSSPFPSQISSSPTSNFFQSLLPPPPPSHIYLSSPPPPPTKSKILKSVQQFSPSPISSRIIHSFIHWSPPKRPDLTNALPNKNGRTNIGKSGKNKDKKGAQNRWSNWIRTRMAFSTEK